MWPISVCSSHLQWYFPCFASYQYSHLWDIRAMYGCDINKFSYRQHSQEIADMTFNCNRKCGCMQSIPRAVSLQKLQCQKIRKCWHLYFNSNSDQKAFTVICIISITTLIVSFLIEGLYRSGLLSLEQNIMSPTPICIKLLVGSLLNCCYLLKCIIYNQKYCFPALES